MARGRPPRDGEKTGAEEGVFRRHPIWHGDWPTATTTGASSPSGLGRVPLDGIVERPGVPHLHRPVPARGGEVAAVGTEHHAPVHVSFEGEGLLAGRRVPHP